MFSTITKLMEHQKAAVTKMLPSRVGALFMEMGTGKTRTAIELAHIRQKKIVRVVWFCPVSTKRTIDYEIKKHTDNVDVQLFDHKTNDQNVCRDCFWNIVGLESMSASSRVVLAANKIIDEQTMVVVDESSYIKGHRAKRTNRIVQICERARYRLILTGTPITQGIQDLFSQMKFLSPKILGYRSWHTFSRNHLEYSDRFKGLITNTMNEDWIAEKISPYVYQVTKEECLDLPDKIYKFRTCALSVDQDAAYDAAKEQFIEDITRYYDGEGPECSIPIFKLFTALRGIVAGYRRDIEDQIVPLETYRIKLLKQILAEIPPDRNVVIWSTSRYAIDQIISVLPPKRTYQYHGGLSENKRHAQLIQWRESGRYLVATQSACGHGIDLTAAHYVIYFTNTFKYSERMQSEDRCHRLGQSQKVTYIDIWADCGIEDKLRDALACKGHIVEQFKKEIEKIKNKRNRADLLKKIVGEL